METPPFTPETVPIPNPQVVSRIAGDEAVLLHPLQGKVSVLNDVGATVWELIDGHRSIRQIAILVSRQFDIDPHTAEADTLNFLAELAERGVVSMSSQQ
jgi:hypothetical protein